MTPLQTLAELVELRGNPAQAKIVRSLAAREDLRVDTFWEDLAGAELWAERDSVASLTWDDPEQGARFARALRLIAQDLELRGFASPESMAWLARLRA